MNTYDIIKSLCDQKGIALTALEKELNFGRGSLGKIKNGGQPSAKRLQQVADYFGVSVEYLLTGDTADNSEFTARNEEERRLLVLFRNTDSVPDSEREEIVEHFEKTIDLYLKARGVIK